MFQKQAKIYGLTDEYCEAKIVHFEECEWDSPQEYWDDAEDDKRNELNGMAYDMWEKDFLDCEESEQWDFLADLDNHTVCGTRKEWQNINAHLTREAAEAFIRRKQHDYPPLRVYVESMYFGWEYQEIIKALCDGRLVLAEGGRPMSNIDKRALRESAERAGQNDWEYVYTSDLSAPGRGYITVGGAEAIYCLNRATGGVKQSENVLRYIAAARPEKMLALLDEMEAAEKRIAELEAREVKLPNPHAHLIWIQAGHAPDDYWDDVAVSHSEKDKCCDGSDRYPVYALWEIKEALSAIGINIAAAGKGERA